uniref:Uncharacterized protein n=1 Tax=Tanacetum cinerariifolium TaxID=118510 RepID=A0A699K940_TANCI|nr:hypothetical protein [Tanacetum cinerariifolium]
MDFVSSPSLNSTSEVPTVFGVSTASPQVSTANLSDATVYEFLANQPNGSQLVREDLEKIHEDDLEEMNLKWQLAQLSMRAKRFFQMTGKKITINKSDIASYDKSKNQESRTTRRTMNVEDTSSKAIVAIDGAGFDWSYMADDEDLTNMAFMALSDSEARCKYHQRERMVNGTNHSRVNHNATIVPKAMLTRTALKPVNSVRPVNPKRNFFKKVNTAKEKVNTARPHSAVVNAIRTNKAKAIKASACWVWRPIKIDSASIVLKKHTYIDALGNISYLTDFKEFDR